MSTPDLVTGKRCAAKVTHRWGWGYQRPCARLAKVGEYCSFHAKRLAGAK